MDKASLEAVAAELLIAVDAHPPVSAFALAHWCGLTLVTLGCEVRNVRGVALFFDANLPMRQMEQEVAERIAHWRLMRAHNDEVGCDDVAYVARALLLPREAFARDIRRTREITELQRIHRYASEEVIKQRILDLAAPAPSLRLVVA